MCTCVMVEWPLYLSLDEGAVSVITVLKNLLFVLVIF